MNALAAWLKNACIAGRRRAVKITMHGTEWQVTVWDAPLEGEGDFANGRSESLDLACDRALLEWRIWVRA